MPPMAPQPCDVLVVGGGPAGSSVAIGLARQGYRVQVVDRQHFPRHRIGESLPPKIQTLLSILGLQTQVEQAGFARMRGTVVADGQGLRFHEFDPEGGRRGYQVDRARFDQLLLAEAARVGATVHHGVAARALLTEGSRVIGAHLEGPDGGWDQAAGWVVDASGAAAWGARALGLGRRDSLRTVALSAYWRGCRLPDDFEACATFFEFLPDGWTWSLLRQDGLRNVTVAVDPSVLQAPGASAHQVYVQRARASAMVSGLIEPAELVGEVGIHDATWRSVRDYAQPGLLFVGDSASLIDPLTSQGVYKAMQSGIVASAVIHTALARPEDELMALDYYRQAQTRFTENYAEIARSSYRASPFADQPFWAERMRSHAAAPAEFEPEQVEVRAQRRADFRAQVQAQGGLRIRLKARPMLQVQPGPVTQGGFVVMAPGFVAGPERIETSLPNAQALLSILDGRSMARVYDDYAKAMNKAPSVRLGRELMNLLSALVAADGVEVLSEDSTP